MAMEHRWAERRAVTIAVRLRDSFGNHAPGRMVNISKSGAFIHTDLHSTFTLRMDVTIDGHVVPAYVVRNSADGIGVEWCGLAPPVAIQLLQPMSAVPLPP